MALDVYPPLTNDNINKFIAMAEASGKKIIIFCENPEDNTDTPIRFSASPNIDHAFVEQAQAGIKGALAAVSDRLNNGAADPAPVPLKKARKR